MNATFKSRVWDIRRERYLSDDDCFLACTGDILEIGGEMVDIDPWYEVERCTGYLARQKKYVYSGDVVTLQWHLGHYRVEWNQDKGVWLFVGIDGGETTGFYKDKPFNVICTIHDILYEEIIEEYNA